VSLSNFLSLRCLSVLFSFSIWRILGNKTILKNRLKNSLLRRQKKSWAFSATTGTKKVTLDTSHTADVCIGSHFYSWKCEYIFSGNENARTRKIIFFPKKTERMKKSHPYRTLMVRYVKVVRKGDQILWQSLVDSIQVFHAVLR
jgi:hypothetical protein